jgi:hypothetical protein
VAIASGSTPWRSIGSTSSRLNSTPSTIADTTMPIATATQNGTANTLIAVSMKNAGSITNSPWAKLMVCDVCHSRVKPIATSA